MGIALSGRNPFFSRVILGAALLLTSFASTVHAQFNAEEIKGEFVERFTRFTEWPTSSISADTTEPFVVVILGKCPFEQHIVDAFRKRRVRGRLPDVKVLPSGARIPKCHLLIIAKSESARVSQIVSSLKGTPILTVANAKNFARKGVHINLFEEREFVRFEVNLKAVRAAGLRISSKMLKHARIIE